MLFRSAVLEQGVRADIVVQLTTLKAAGDGALALFERDVNDRRKQTESLFGSAGELRDDIRRFQTEAQDGSRQESPRQDGN